MKTKLKTNKLPRARVLFGTAREYRQTSTHLFQEKSVDHYDVPSIVLPQPSLSAAKKALKWAKLGEAEQIEAIAKVMFTQQYPCAMPWGSQSHKFLNERRKEARAIIQLLGKGANSK